MPRLNLLPSIGAKQLHHFKRVARLLALLSLVIAAIAVLLVVSGDEGVHIHVMIATALGVGLTVFLGTGLMSLVFLSSSSGHDEAAARSQQESEKE